jgi:hypothetical protein
MTKNTPKSSGINKNSNNNNDNNHNDTRRYLIVELSDKEKSYFERLASIMSKVHVAQDGRKLLPDKSLASLGKMALGMLTHVSLTQVLIQSELAKTLPDKEALNEFIAFRRDYMDITLDKQIADLKEIGIIKKRKRKKTVKKNLMMVEKKVVKNKF